MEARRSAASIKLRAGGAAGVGLLAAVALGPQAIPAPQSAIFAREPETLLARARTIFGARERRPFVVYTIRREESFQGRPVSAGTYAERVWYRQRDGLALARRIEDGAVVGPMISERPTLDGDVDPGPPTADVFEAGAPAAEATPAPAPSGFALLAAVTVRGEFDYHVSADGEEDGLVRLRLEPRRDPERNRLREVWLDARNGTLQRYVMRDRVYFASRTGGVPGSFEFREGVAGDVPSIVSVASLPDDTAVAGIGGAPSLSYRFEDVTFPVALPDWYFDAYAHAKHAREAPNR
jgi:hypothetical protein